MEEIQRKEGVDKKPVESILATDVGSTTTKAVSYTHLDVYKRQVISFIIN